MCECANNVYRRVRDGEIALHTAQDNLRDILRFIRVVDVEPDVSVTSLLIAKQIGWGSSYDPHYLAMAQLLDCPFWTADRRLWRAASADHPRIMWLGQIAGS